LKGKGLRSICNKILVQICAKVGGIPWSISDMPFTEQPTMLVGVDTYHKHQGKKKRAILSMVATMNKTFSKYWSTCRPQQ
jgi:aubergine-like protein